MMHAHETELERFGRHVSKLLIKQTLNKLVDHYVSSSSADAKTIDGTVKQESNKLFPSTIERIYGALLFVDISGFTVLSQKLTVEDLRRHINIYFTRILKIVSSFDGDVIKFAGDAMFIVWQVELLDDGMKNVALDNIDCFGYV